jgi:hypothetical protein
MGQTIRKLLASLVSALLIAACAPEQLRAQAPRGQPEPKAPDGQPVPGQPTPQPAPTSAQSAPIPTPAPAQSEPQPTPAAAQPATRPTRAVDRSKHPLGRSPGAGGLFLDLMKLCLTDLVYEDNPDVWTQREFGHDDGGRSGATMIGLERLDNIQKLMEDTLAKGIPGDFLEAGAWRGGATVFMRAVLKVHGIKNRKVWVADSFEGFRADTSVDPADRALALENERVLIAPLETAKGNFSRFDLLDDQVVFLRGWFKDTLPVAPIHKLAVLRIDADLYQSTMDALVALYPKVSPGGYIINDDYGAYPDAAGRAVDEFRAKHGIKSTLHKIDWTGVYWQK